MRNSRAQVTIGKTVGNSISIIATVLISERCPRVRKAFTLFIALHIMNNAKIPGYAASWFDIAIWARLSQNKMRLLTTKLFLIKQTFNEVGHDKNSTLLL